MKTTAADCFRKALSYHVLKLGRGGQAGIADKAKISRSQINDILAGRNDGTDETREKIAAAIGMTYEDMLALGRRLLAGEDVREKPNVTEAAPPLCRAPLISWVQAGDWTEAVEYQEVAQFVYATRPCGPHTFALTIHGDSMEPEFREGDIIVVDPAVQHRNGSFIVAKNGSNEATFKQLVMDGDNVFLKPLNSRYPIKDMTGIEFRIIGVVVQKVKNY